jgi:hypothetical protein
MTLNRAATQAQQRGVKQAAPTQPDADDPCAPNYGDYAMVQSTQVTQRKWTRVEQLGPELAGQKVRVCAAPLRGCGVRGVRMLLQALCCCT